MEAGRIFLFRHRPMRISILLAVSLFLAAAPAGAQQEPTGILFAVQAMEDGGALLEPVILLRGTHGFDRPEMSDTASPEVRRWLRPGADYGLFQRGERVGDTRVVAAEELACVGLGARASFTRTRAVDEAWLGLAAQGLPEQRGAPWLRSATPAERRALDRLAAALFHAHGIDVSDRPLGDTAASVLLFGPDTRPLLVGSYELMNDKRSAATFIVAEERQEGYRPVYAWFHESHESDREARALVDAIDLDGEGEPELVLRNSYYEMWDFVILRRTDSGWSEVYQGGGAGC